MKIIFTLLILLFIQFSYSQISGLEVPRCDSTYVEHGSFSLLYSEQHEQSYWVAYDLVPSDTIKNYERRSKFNEDELILTKSAKGSDYKKSGFDRGHLVPARDMRYGFQEIIEVNVYSNISPQRAGFNRGIWRVLEANITHLTRKYEHVYIVTGPILTDNLPSIGMNKVSVPNFFYKVIMVYDGSEYKSIAFVIPNKKGEYKLDKYSVSVNYVETLTGFDFFYKLNNEVIENNCDYNVIF